MRETEQQQEEAATRDETGKRSHEERYEDEKSEGTKKDGSSSADLSKVSAIWLLLSQCIRGRAKIKSIMDLKEERER